MDELRKEPGSRFFLSTTGVPMSSDVNILGLFRSPVGALFLLLSFFLSFFLFSFFFKAKKNGKASRKAPKTKKERKESVLFLVHLSSCSSSSSLSSFFWDSPSSISFPCAVAFYGRDFPQADSHVLVHSNQDLIARDNLPSEVRV